MHYLTQRKGNYYLRLPVPKTLQSKLQQVEIFTSLQTKDRAIARVLALSLSASFSLQFQKLQAMAKPTVQELLEKLHAGQTSEFEGKFNARTGEIGFRTDPGLTGAALEEDRKAGMSWQKETIADNPQVFSSPISEPQNTPAEAKLEMEMLKSSLNMNVKSKNIHSAVDEFLHYIEHDKKLTSVRHYRDSLNHFVTWITAFHPNISVHRITFEHCRDYKKVLEKLPNNKKQNSVTIGHSNVNKRMGFVQSFFKWCQQREQGYIRKGQEFLPTDELVKKTDYSKSNTSYLPFTQEELQKIFDIQNWKFQLKTPYGFWLPLLGIFTGASHGELMTLKPENINNHNNEDVWTIAIENRSKNQNSKRKFPIHQTLIDIGFLQYVKDIEEAFSPYKSVLEKYCEEHTCETFGSIFPFPIDLDKQSDKAFRQLLIRLQIKNSRKVFHSFSKTVSVRLADTSMPDKFQRHLIGHLPFDIHRNIYADKVNPISYYKSQLDEHLNYKIDFSSFRYTSGMFDHFVQKQLQSLQRLQKFGHK